MSWPLLLLLAAGSYGLKVLGVTALGSVVERRLGPVVSLLPAALFSALIVVMTFEEAGELVLDSRVAGVAVGAAATWRKAPLLIVVAAAMAVTAGLRLLV